MDERDGIVLAGELPMQTSPAPGQPPARGLPRGAPVRILRDLGGWYEVDTDLGRGWVRSRGVAPTPRGVTDYLWQHAELTSVALEAPADRLLAEPPDPLGGALARTWNQYGGLLGALCNVVGVDPAGIVATLHTESGGRGMGPDGRMIIRFENHLYRRFLGDERAALFEAHFRFDPGTVWQGHLFRPAGGDTWLVCHQDQAGEWTVLDFARGLDSEAALLSISMGMPQIMGFNHALIGYASVHDMFDRFANDIRFQILGMFDFIRGHGDTSPMLEGLRLRNYEAFATGYNGNGQAAFYGGLIRASVARFERLQGGAAPPPPPALDGDVYVVRPGDTLGAIAARFGATVAAIVAANNIANPDVIPLGMRLRIPGAAAPPAGDTTPAAPVTSEAPPAERMYIVQPGDILSRIAARFGVSVQAIIASNGIADADLIQPGQALRIPPPDGQRDLRPPRPGAAPPADDNEDIEHLVLQGDTLRSIAAEHGLTLEALAAAHDVHLVPGQLLRLPTPSRRPR